MVGTDAGRAGAPRAAAPAGRSCKTACNVPVPSARARSLANTCSPPLRPPDRHAHRCAPRSGAPSTSPSPSPRSRATSSRATARAAPSTQPSAPRAARTPSGLHIRTARRCALPRGAGVRGASQRGLSPASRTNLRARRGGAGARPSGRADGLGGPLGPHGPGGSRSLKRSRPPGVRAGEDPPETTSSRPGAARRVKDTGGVLLSRALAGQVPSALRGLTALFGMGRGVSPSP
jgi:hypothetical protein